MIPVFKRFYTIKLYEVVWNSETLERESPRWIAVGNYRRREQVLFGKKKKRKEVKTRKRRGKKSSQPRTIEWRWSCTLRWTRVELRRVYLDGLEVKAPNGCEYIVAINSTKSEYSRSSGDWSDHFSEKPAGSFLCTESTRWEAARDEKIKEKRYVAPPPRHPYLSQHRI